MADNTTLNTGTGGDVIATDDLTTLNGGTVSGFKAQRVKVGFGDDGVFRDASAAFPLPVDTTNRVSTTGTITTSTSTVTLTGLSGGSATIFINGTYSGVTFTPEISPDGSTWFLSTAQPVSSSTAGISSSLSPTANSSTAYQVPLFGATAVRVRATAYTSGTANVVLVCNGYSPPPSRQIVDLNNNITQTVSLPSYTSALATQRDAGPMTASGNGTSTPLPATARNLIASVNVQAVSGTTPSITYRLQWSPDAGTTWLDIDTTNLQTTAITSAVGWVHLRLGPDFTTAANAALKDICPPTLRWVWTVSGTTPSFTAKTYMNFGS